MSLLAAAASAGAAPAPEPEQWMFTGGVWTQSGDALTSPVSGGATAYRRSSVPLSSATITATLAFRGGAPAGLIVRRVSPITYLLVQVDPDRSTIELVKVTDGTRRHILKDALSAGMIGPGGTCDIRVDLNGPDVTVYRLDGQRLCSCTDDQGLDSDVYGVEQVGVDTTTFRTIAATAHRGPRINWPRFTHRNATEDIPLVPGTWEDTDINNPNIVWDPVTSRYVMYYTGYTRNKPSGDDGVQFAGIAYASTLDGPWTKEPNNPVINDLSTGAWSQNGGMERLADGTWIIVANAQGGSQGWVYTAPRPSGPWTRTPNVVIQNTGDPYLRINQTTGALEQWGWTNIDGVRYGHRWTSVDGGKTWSNPVRVTPSSPIQGRNNGEQVIFVPPGKEGQEMWVVMDFIPDENLSKGRGMLLAMTPNNGIDWYWHVALTKYGSLGWDSAAAFDSYLAYDEARKRLYLYHSGSTRPDTGLLNMSIQIGHAWAEWDHTVPAITPNA